MEELDSWGWDIDWLHWQQPCQQQLVSVLVCVEIRIMHVDR